MNFAHPHFAEPHWLWLAGLAPLSVLLLHRYAAWAREKQLALFAAPELVPNLLRSHSPVRRSLKNLLLMLAVAGMGLALARPQWGETAEVSRALGEDILFLLDCSKSMLAADVRPNRLGRARYAILDFVQRHGSGRVGLVAFSGQAFLQCPLTFDYDAFRESLLAVDEKTIPVPGTDIGRALDEGYRAMEKNNRRKIMVLLTDGEDLEKTGIQTARNLAEKGIVVFSVGVGTAAGSPVQFVNEQGITEVVHDTDGSVVQSRLDEATLTSIAQATKGTYEPLGVLGEGLTRVRRKVESSTAFSDSSNLRKMGVDRYHVPVAAVCLILIIESLIGTRRKMSENNADKAMRDQSHQPATIAALLLFCANLNAFAATSASEVPSSPPELYNHGTQKFREGKLREAESSLQTALASQNEKVQVPALFNLGHVRFQEGLEELKGGPNGKASEALSKRATQSGEEAIQAADYALSGWDVQSMVAAYMQGRGARKELKAATEAVKRALESHGVVLGKWQRASGDFKSAYELRPADLDAKSNAEVVDRNIARLVDMQEMMMQCSQCNKANRESLRAKMAELKKRMPKQVRQQCENGEEEEDEEDQDKPPKEPKAGQQEAKQREGKEKFLTPEEAARLLEMLRLDANRKLPLGMNDTGAAKDRKRRDW